MLKRFLLYICKWNLSRCAKKIRQNINWWSVINVLQSLVMTDFSCTKSLSNLTDCQINIRSLISRTNISWHFLHTELAVYLPCLKFQECETHSYGDKTEKFCYCTYYLCNSSIGNAGNVWESDCNRLRYSTLEHCLARLKSSKCTAIRNCKDVRKQSQWSAPPRGRFLKIIPIGIPTYAGMKNRFPRRRQP